jgi:hypothetical protein
MTSGGARIRSGPAPDPNALRRDRDKAEWNHLPAIGRQGPPPDWPLMRPTRRELVLWEREWARPQALMWEANGQVAEVALYVRSLRDAEKPKATVAARTLVRQQMDALGLTIPGLRANRWIIAGEAVAQHVDRRASPTASAKERLQLVSGGEASS